MFDPQKIIHHNKITIPSYYILSSEKVKSLPQIPAYFPQSALCAKNLGGKTNCAAHLFRCAPEKLKNFRILQKNIQKTSTKYINCIKKRNLHVVDSVLLECSKNFLFCSRSFFCFWSFSRRSFFNNFSISCSSSRFLTTSTNWSFLSCSCLTCF